MPTGRSASAARTRPATRTRPASRRAPRRNTPRRKASTSPALRIRWDRVGRIGLLVVLAVVGVLYIEHTLSYISTRSLAAHEAATVKRLTKDNAELAKEQKSLGDPATIVRDARALGMIQAGERPYVLTSPARQ